MGLGTASLAGCGLLLYPERRGQRGGRLDWGVVLLDGLGLLLFFVPGVIAFVVDFTTGTIYLPPEPHYFIPESYGQLPTENRERPMVAVHVPREELTRQRIEQVVSEHASRPVQLVEGKYQTQRLHRVKDFWAALRRNTPA